MTEPEILTAEEAAKILRVSVKLLYKLIDVGDIKAKRIGRIYRIPRAAIESYLQGENHE